MSGIISPLNRRMFCKSVLVLNLLLMIWMVFSSRVIAVDDVTSSYFEQLRRRELFRIAEGHCIDRLAAADLSEVARARLTLELSRTLAAHARHASGAESIELFERAQSGLDELLKRQPRTPLYLLLVVQRALLPAGRGEFLRWQGELFPNDVKLRAQAVATLDDAIMRLGDVDRRLSEQLRGGTPNREENSGVRPHEIRALLNDVRFALGTSHLERARLFAGGSAERVAGLAEADECLRRFASGPDGEELTRQSQIRLAESNRLRGDYKQALAMLSVVAKGSLSPTDLDEITAQRARIHLEDGHPEEAARLLVEHQHTREGISGELLFLRVQALIDLWMIANARKTEQGTKLAGELFDEVKSHVARAEREVGGYWAYRCRVQLDTARETSLYGGEVAEIVRLARSIFAEGNIEGAAGEYARAAKLAEQSGRGDQAFELGFSRASILLNAGKFEPAGQGFQQLAASYPKQIRAAEAHLLWAWSVGKLYEQTRSEIREKEFVGALEAHRAKYPSHATTVDATWMLAEFEDRRQQFEHAVKLYAAIPATSAHGAQAQVGAARCYVSILERLRGSRERYNTWEREAIRHIEPFTASFPAEPGALNDSQAELSLLLARIRLNQAQPDYTRADRLLERIFSSVPQIHGEEPAGAAAAQSAAWKAVVTSAAQLRIVSLAGQKRLEEADSFVRRLSDASPAEVLGVLDGLMQVGATSDTAARRGLGELQLKAAGELVARRKELSSADVQRLDRCLAQAYLATGQPSRAIPIYESLMEANPRDRVLTKTVAGLLIECGTPQCVEKALACWRRIEAGEKQGSYEWLEASYSIAWCCLHLKQYDECRKILKVTGVLYPELGGRELKLKYGILQDELERAAGK